MVLLQEEINKHIKWPRSWYNNLKEGFIVYRLTVKLGFGRQTAYPQQQPKKKKKKEKKRERRLTRCTGKLTFWEIIDKVIELIFYMCTENVKLGTTLISLFSSHWYLRWLLKDIQWQEMKSCYYAFWTHQLCLSSYVWILKYILSSLES